MSEQEILDAPPSITEFNAIEAGLAELRTELKGVQFDVTTTIGDKAARAARSKCISIRTGADAAYENWNKPMLAKQRGMRAELARIKEEVKAVEDPIDAQIKAEEERKAAIKAAKEAAELARQQAIQARITALHSYPLQAVGKGSADIAAVLAKVAELPIATEFYEHRTGEAMELHAEVAGKLEEMHAAVLAQEQEAARVAAERVEQERVRKEQEAAAAAERKAEADRIAAERAKLERQRQEQEAAAKAAREAEEKRLAEQREAMHAEQKRLDAQRAENAQKDAASAAAFKKQQDEAAAAMKEQQAAAQRMEMAMQEIQGIQQQAFIAVTGRLGVRAGGTLECARATLAETEAWPIEAAHFGLLTTAAQAAKDSAIAEIRRVVADLERKEAAAHEEREQAEAAARVQREAQEAERNAAEQAERERLAEAARREAEEFSKNGPGDGEIVRVLAEHYDVLLGDVIGWLAKFDATAASVVDAELDA